MSLLRSLELQQVHSVLRLLHLLKLDIPREDIELVNGVLSIGITPLEFIHLSFLHNSD
jgi:hypothetical protein